MHSSGVDDREQSMFWMKVGFVLFFQFPYEPNYGDGQSSQSAADRLVQEVSEEAISCIQKKGNNWDISKLAKNICLLFLWSGL